MVMEVVALAATRSFCNQWLALRPLVGVSWGVENKADRFAMLTSG